jgi:hypothetical protein
LNGPSRFGAIVIVTLLSCVVLGAVWGLVIYLLPQNDSQPEFSPVVPVPEPPPQSAPPTSLPASPSPDPAVLSTMADETSLPSRSGPLERSAVDAVRVSPGMDVKCDMEIDTLCPEDEGDRRACLQRKASQLSAPCQPILRERLVRMKENLQHLRAACEADRRRFCRDVPSGGGAIVQCLEAHAQEVSEQCFQFLPKRGRLLN